MTPPIKALPTDCQGWESAFGQDIFYPPPQLLTSTFLSTSLASLLA